MKAMLKPFLLPALLGGLMGSIYFLPKQSAIAESAIEMELPQRLGDWHLNLMSPTENEIAFLAKDTQFSKAICLLPRVNAEPDSMGRLPADQADLSIVLSGYDLNSSIHRPERCMPAQGHTILSSSNSEIPLPSGRKLPVCRLLSQQEIATAQDPKHPLLAHCLTYYFFVGHGDIVASHESRTFIDIRDRLLKGQDQRWAYVTISIRFGELPGLPAGTLPTAEDADKKVREFLAELADKNINWQEIAS